MGMLGEIKISVREYAKQLGVDEKAVRKAIAEGKIKKGYDTKTKKITASIADKEWGDVHKVKKPRAGLSKQKLLEKEKKESEETGSKKKLQEKTENEESSSDELLAEIKLHANLTYAEAARRREIIAAALDRIKLQEAEGILVRRAEVEKALYALGDQLKKALLNIPARIIDEVMSSPNKVEAINILDRELKSVLETFATLDKLQLSV